MITQNRKAVSAVIATIMLLMITVSLAGVFYVFSSTLASQTTSSSSEQASQLTAQLSMCMQVDNIVDNQVTLRNCGKGVIENKSLVVMMDDFVLGASTNTINEGNSSVVNVSGLWQVPFGKHSLKITNGAAVAQSLVEIIPNPNGLAGSWDFDEGSGNKAYDNSGNGNAGTLVNMNTTGNATSGWAAGKFGSGLLFDGTDDYVDAGNGASLRPVNEYSVEFWFNSNDAYFWNMPEDWNSIIRHSNLFEVYYRGVYRQMLFRIYQAGGYTENGPAISFSSNTWYHFVATTDKTQFYVYINGVQYGPYASAFSGQNFRTPNGNLDIGSSGDFSGTIDEVRIWSKAFSPDETVAMKQII